MGDATPLPLLGPRRPRDDGGFLWESIVNGPVRSRRLGVSLGLNLIPQGSKLCTFDCPYCECGFNTPRAPGARWPSPDEVAHSLRRALSRLPRAPDWITFAGNGEPTMHPRFPVVVARVLEVRAALAPATRVAILSNGLAAAKPTVREALRALDARLMKLDPGPMNRVNGRRYDVERLIDAYRALRPFTIQAMVAQGTGWDGSSAASLAAWLPCVTHAAPEAVQLYSLDRPAPDPSVRKVPRERLEEMARAVREALPRCDVAVF
ncbi:MAG TPA: radical SAM protein [Gemmatimonadales bacterium]|nr:radical SAM protein [Gemmatimonadales bacterium]